MGDICNTFRVGSLIWGASPPAAQAPLPFVTWRELQALMAGVLPADPGPASDGALGDLLHAHAGGLLLPPKVGFQLNPQ